MRSDALALIRHEKPATAFYWEFYSTIEEIRNVVNDTDVAKMNKIGELFETLAPIIQDLVNGELADPLSWCGFFLGYSLLNTELDSITNYTTIVKWQQITTYDGMKTTCNQTQFHFSITNYNDSV